MLRSQIASENVAARIGAFFAAVAGRAAPFAAACEVMAVEPVNAFDTTVHTLMPRCSVAVLVGAAL